MTPGNPGKGFPIEAGLEAGLEGGLEAGLGIVHINIVRQDTSQNRTPCHRDSREGVKLAHLNKLGPSLRLG
jgi:hypothetical protein